MRRTRYFKEFKIQAVKEAMETGKPSVVITASNQLWEADIRYGYIHGEDRFLFVCSLIDIYDRSIIDYHVGLECTAEKIVQVFKQSIVETTTAGLLWGVCPSLS